MSITGAGNCGEIFLVFRHCDVNGRSNGLFFANLFFRALENTSDAELLSNITDIIG